MAKIEVDDLKMLRETLCLAQWSLNYTGQWGSNYHSDRIQKLINQIDILRPLGSNGKHGNLHTMHCGCDFNKHVAMFTDSSCIYNCSCYIRKDHTYQIGEANATD